jgi:hypothetical protein
MGRLRPSGVLPVVKDSGDPRSMYCIVEFDDARELILFPALPPNVVGQLGSACVLFHRHNADLSSCGRNLFTVSGSEKCC